MTALLHIFARPRGQASDSSALAGAFRQRVTAPRAPTLDHVDFFDGTLSPFGCYAA